MFVAAKYGAVPRGSAWGLAPKNYSYERFSLGSFKGAGYPLLHISVARFYEAEQVEATKEAEQRHQELLRDQNHATTLSPDGSKEAESVAG